MKKTLVILIFFNIQLQAQEVDSSFVNPIINEFESNLSDDEIIDENINQVDLFDFDKSYKFNLNGASLEQIKSLKHLNVFKQNSLYFYLKNSGEIYDYYEILSLNDFTQEDIEYLRRYTVIDKSQSRFKLTDLISRPKYNLIMRYIEKENKNNYIGSNEALLIRHKTELSKHLKYGFTMEKDSGEKYGSGINLFDFNSFYLEFKSNKILKSLIIGDYYANFGTGFSLWNSYKFNDTYNENMFLKNSFRVQSGTNESKFFRGLASSIQFQNLELNLMYSKRKIDSNADTSSYSFSTINESGYHRTESELSGKNNLQKEDLAGVLTLKADRFKISAGYIYTKLNAIYTADSSKYLNQLIPSKDEMHIYFIHGKYLFEDLIIESELTFNHPNYSKPNYNFTANYHPSDDLNFTVIKRKRYPENVNLNSATFSLNPKYGEDILRIVSNWEVLPKTKISSFWEFQKSLHFPFSYRETANNKLFGLKVEQSIARNHSAFLLYNLKTSKNDKYNQISLKYVGKLTEWISIKVNSKIRFLNQNEQSTFQSLELKFENSSKNLSVKIIASYFDVSSWQNRIYSYESDILYSFGIKSFYQKGSRLAIVPKINFAKHFTFWLKYSFDLIESFKLENSNYIINTRPSNHEIKLQLRIKF